METRDSRDVIVDIKELVNSKGYIYALCLIIMEDFHFDAEHIHEINMRSRLNKNEVSLILGLIIQNPISLEKPDSPVELISLKNMTYSLMEELHGTTMTPIINKFKPLVENANIEFSKRDFFCGEDLYIEPIFYSGDGLYDFQYMEFLKNKYKYDEPWLNENKNFYFDEVIEITSQLKLLHQKKISKVNFIGLKENRSKIIKEFKKNKSIPKKDRNENIDEYLTMMEFYQYFELFETEIHIEKELTSEEIAERGWESFYDGLINLFCVSKSDFDNNLDVSSYLYNFSIPLNSIGLNKGFENIGDFNLFSARPIISLSSERFFIPITFSVFEAVYESPYYWLLEDKKYKSKLAANRGKVGEEIAYDLLKKVFGAQRVFKSVRIESKKGHDDTDIDVLCVLGSIALCVQVKSKKLTQLSRKGDFQQLNKDFKGAVQDAYEQGIVCRNRIIEKTANFYNSDGERIKLSEGIEEVYILGVTTENYPTLTHQTSSLLIKEESAPEPLFLTIFDLELVLFYLDSPYDFMYYVRQRIDLMEYFFAIEEIHYLGYHLINKLWKDPEADFIQLDPGLGQLIDRNYYPFKLGIETSKKNDKIENRWKNKDFEILCNQIDEINSPKKTDIIFQLLDWTPDTRDNLIKQIKVAKENTIKDGSSHNFSIMAGLERSSFGLTFISWDNNNVNDLNSWLLRLSKGRKYKSKADIWIGIGCLRSSGRLVDSIVFSNVNWEFDENLEEENKILFSDKNKGTPIKLGKKIGRNEICRCGSGLKHKKCCGRKY